MIPTWYECSNLLVEIKHLYTLFKIGKSIGKLIGIDSEYDKTSNVKFLIDEEPNQKKIRRKKIITNRSIYEIELKKYEGEIKGIIKTNIEIDHNISTIEESFRNIRTKKREQKIKTNNKDKYKKIEKLDERKNIEQSTQTKNTPIVKKSKEQSQL